MDPLKVTSLPRPSIQPGIPINPVATPLTRLNPALTKGRGWILYSWTPPPAPGAGGELPLRYGDTIHRYCHRHMGIKGCRSLDNISIQDARQTQNYIWSGFMKHLE
jgi:hypothetical protein